MAAMGAVGLGVYNADPAPSRSFPITFSDGEVVYPQFAYPLRTEIIPIWEAALLANCAKRRGIVLSIGALIDRSILPSIRRIGIGYT